MTNEKAREAAEKYADSKYRQLADDEWCVAFDAFLAGRESLEEELKLATRRLGPAGWKILKEYKALKAENEVLRDGLRYYDTGEEPRVAGRSLAAADAIREGKG